MPFQPGILFSALLLILCLGINLTYYPKVRGMFHKPTDEVVALSSELSEPSKISELSKQLVLKSNKTDSISSPSLPQNKENSSQSSVPVPATPVKTSKVNKPIQLDPLPEQPKEKEKTVQTSEKKSDTSAFLLETKTNNPKTTINETNSEKNEEKPKQLEMKQPEPKQAEPKQLESKQPESKQSELKQPEPKQSELKQPEPKQSTFSAPTVLPLPSLEETFPLQDDKKSAAPSKTSSLDSDTEIQKKTESIIQNIQNIQNTQNTHGNQKNQNKLTVKPESAFLPIVPPSLEKEYWEPNNRDVNQLAVLTPSAKIPMLSDPVLKPSQPTPAYANAYQEPKPPASPPNLLLQEKSNPVEKNIPIEKPKPKPPTFIWETIDSALERPLMYENP